MGISACMRDYSDSVLNLQKIPANVQKPGQLGFNYQLHWPVFLYLKLWCVICSEYARPHAGFSPGTLPRTSLGLPPQCMDPMLHYQLNSMYGPTARERWVLQSVSLVTCEHTGSHILERSQRMLSKNRPTLKFKVTFVVGWS